MYCMYIKVRILLIVFCHCITGAEARVAVPGNINRGNRSQKVRLANFSTAMESIQAETEPVELDDEDIP